MIKTLEKIHTVGMSREDWLQHRKHSIGGSDASAIVGLNNYATPFTVWAEKLDLIPEKEDSEAMRVGRDLEEYVAKRFCEATGKKVRRENYILRNPEIPYAHANVDRMVVGEDAGLECKTTSVLNLKKFGDKEFPDTYYVQCMHYMMVTGCKKWYLAVLVLGKEFIWYEIERNEAEIEALKSVETEFWAKVCTHTKPEMTGGGAEAETLGVLYPGGDPDKVDLAPLQGTLDTISQIDEQIKELKKQSDALKNTVRDYLEDSEYGGTADYTVTWHPQTRSTFDSKGFMADHSGVDFTKYVKESQMRVLKITKKKAK